MALKVKAVEPPYHLHPECRDDRERNPDQFAMAEVHFLSEWEFNHFVVPGGVDVDADLMLFRGVEETAPTDGDRITLDGDITDLPFGQDLHLSTRGLIRCHQYLQLVTVGSWDRIDLITRIIGIDR